VRARAHTQMHKLQATIGIAVSILMAFLFVGFNAFTDTRATIYGLINAAITFMSLAAVDSAGRVLGCIV